MIARSAFLVVVLTCLARAQPGQPDYLLSPPTSGVVAPNDREHERRQLVHPALAEFRSRWYEPVWVGSVAPPRAEEPYYIFVLTHNPEHGYAMKAVQYLKKGVAEEAEPSLTVVKEVVLEPFPLAVAEKIRASAAGALAAIRFPPSGRQVLDGHFVEVALWQDASLRSGQAVGRAEGPRANLMISLMLALEKAVFQEAAVATADRWTSVLEIAEKVAKKFPVAPPANVTGGK